MKYFVLQYEVVEGFVARRAPHREEHLRLVREAHARGDLLFAGAVGDPPDGALLVFRATSPDIVEEFARTDPYVRHGLVTLWQVRPWGVVVEAGEGACNQ
jgi:uncharacterized protein